MLGEGQLVVRGCRGNSIVSTTYCTRSVYALSKGEAGLVGNGRDVVWLSHGTEEISWAGHIWRKKSMNDFGRRVCLNRECFVLHCIKAVDPLEMKH